MPCTSNHECGSTSYCDPHTSNCHTCDLICDRDRDSANECKNLCPDVWSQGNTLETLATTVTTTTQLTDFTVSLIIILSLGLLLLPLIIFFIVRYKQGVPTLKNLFSSCPTLPRIHSKQTSSMIDESDNEEKHWNKDNDIQKNLLEIEKSDNTDNKDSIYKERTTAMSEATASVHGTAEANIIAQSVDEASSAVCGRVEYHCTRSQHEDELSAKEETEGNHFAYSQTTERTEPKIVCNRSDKVDAKNINKHLRNSEEEMRAVRSVGPCLDSVEFVGVSDLSELSPDAMLSLHSRASSEAPASCELSLWSDDELHMSRAPRSNPGAKKEDCNKRWPFDRVMKAFDAFDRENHEMPFVRGCQIEKERLAILISNSYSLSQAHSEIMNVMPSTVDSQVVHMNYI